jgi:Domain of unknown function (DUF1707)
MAGPGDEIAAGAGGRGHLRASHADRERVTEILKAAFVQGRLGRDEFDLRVGQALASRTYAELAALTADIPAGLTAAPPPKPANAQARPPVKKIVIACGWVVPPAAMVVAAFLADSDLAGTLAFAFLFLYFIVGMTAGAAMLAAWLEKRSGGRSPRRPAAGAGGQAPQRLPSADPGRQLPPPSHGHQHTAEAARRRPFRPALPVRGHCAGGALVADTGPASG